MSLISINPYSNLKIEEFEEYSDKKLQAILSGAAGAFEKWRRVEPAKRKYLMENVAVLLKQNRDIYAEAITAEMGKPVSESRAEVEKCSWVCDYYAENAEAFLADDIIASDATISYVTYEPLGTILGIMPWNFPFWQVFRFAVPTLMAGNTVLLKHASNVQICARHIENIFIQAGFPHSVFSNLVIGSGKAGEIIESNEVKAVSLTGSEFAGQKVAETAGRKIKKTLLELGGSNAFVILPDADLRKAANIGLKARMQNAGQSCIAAKRFIVHKDISKEFIEIFRLAMAKLKMGDPNDEMTDIGPLASSRQADILERQVKDSVDMGARVILGGVRNSNFYSPTLLIDVRPGMPVFDEEVFGPVAPVIIAEDRDEAVKLANQTMYGLGVSVITSDLEEAKKMVPLFDDGAVFINALVKSDPRLPFGGTKLSGYGRELAINGIREFVNIKTVYINKI